jgi:hypothetical protein
MDNIADEYCQTVSKAIATSETALVSLLHSRGEVRQMKREGGGGGRRLQDSNSQRRSAFAEAGGLLREVRKTQDDRRGRLPCGL